MDADIRFASWLKEEIKTSANIDVSPDFFEVKDLNRGVFFEVPDEMEMKVVNDIYRMEDMDVFRYITYDEESGNYLVENYFDE